MSVALLCPTKGRPEQFNRMVKSARMTASNSENVYIYVAWTEVGGRYDNAEMPRYGIITPDGMPTAYKWNILAEAALKNPQNKLFMLCADDIIFSTPTWDKGLLDHYDALENKIHVYHLLDSRTGHGTPHPIVTREWIEFFGYMLPPIFLHWYVDTWTVEIAKANDCFTHMTDYQLLHDKPSDRGQPDATHTGIRAMGWHERDQWVHEHCQHFLELEKKRLFSAMHKGAIMNGRISEGLRA